MSQNNLILGGNLNCELDPYLDRSSLVPSSATLICQTSGELIRVVKITPIPQDINWRLNALLLTEREFCDRKYIKAQIAPFSTILMIASILPFRLL